MIDVDFFENRLVKNMIANEKEFSFFQVVYMLERFSGQTQVVGNADAKKELLRFCPDPSLAFPASDITQIEKVKTTNGEKLGITTTFLGLYGTVTPLPLFYSEEILAMQEDEDPVRSFMDIFHHRMISLFYRCWIKYRYYLQYRDDGMDDFSKRIFSLFGMGNISLEDMYENSGVKPFRLLKYAGLLSMQCRSASIVENIVSDYFDGISIQISQCISRWVFIRDDQRSRLGQSNYILGKNIVVGERVRESSGKFRIHLTPRSAEEYQEFLLGKSKYKALNSLVSFCLTDKLDFDLQLEIFAYEPLKLSFAAPMQLGMLSILGDNTNERATVVV